MDLKRTLEEVNALYSLEPELRDIFVEGPGDKCFLDWYLHRKGITNVSVYQIDLIDVPGEVVARYGLPAGSNRSRVIALSCELASRQPEQRRVMCVVDRDYEDYCPICKSNPYLAFTDGNSLELYALTPTVVDKFLLVALGGFPLSVNTFIGQLRGILEQVFAIRLANERLQWGMTWVPFARYVEVMPDNIAFNQNEFVRAYLQKNKKWGHRQHFEEALGEAKDILLPDLIRRIRGHDLAGLILLIVRKLKRERQFGNAETLAGCLMTAIEADDLELQSLFRRVDALSG
jgi:hypothetical protein